MARLFQIEPLPTRAATAPASRTVDNKPPGSSPFARTATLLAATFFFLSFLALHSLAASTNAPPRAKLKISGYGILGNRELKRILSTVELGRTKPQFFGAPFVEDAAL